MEFLSECLWNFFGTVLLIGLLLPVAWLARVLWENVLEPVFWLITLTFINACEEIE